MDFIDINTVPCSGSLLEDGSSLLSSSLAASVASINNSSTLLPDTRLDLHTVYTQPGDLVSVYQVSRDRNWS